MIRTVAFATVLLPTIAAAYWEKKSDSHRLELAGSLRSVIGGMDQPGLPKAVSAPNPSGVSQSTLRLTGEGEQGEWLKLQAHVLGQWSFASAPASAVGLAGAGTRRFRALDLDKQLVASSGSTGLVDVDRLNAKLSFGPADLTVGRQAINFSKAWFWNPLDIFLPFDPHAFDRDYKPGVDALKLDWALGELAGLNLVAAAGPTVRIRPTGDVVPTGRRWDATWYGSAVIARAFATAGGVDLAVQGGKVYGGYQLGLGFALNVQDFGVRGEGAYVLALPGPADAVPSSDGAPRELAMVESHASAVVGVDRRFDNSLALAVEYGFNGAGVVGGDYLAATFRQRAGALSSLSRHVLGMNASYELLPVLTGRLGAVTSLTDRSLMFMPALTWSVANEAELVTGALVGIGKRTDFGTPVPTPRSEFGSFPHLFYGEFKLYF